MQIWGEDSLRFYVEINKALWCGTEGPPKAFEWGSGDLTVEQIFEFEEEMSEDED